MKKPQRGNLGGSFTTTTRSLDRVPSRTSYTPRLRNVVTPTPVSCKGMKPSPSGKTFLRLLCFLNRIKEFLENVSTQFYLLISGESPCNFFRNVIGFVRFISRFSMSLRTRSVRRRLVGYPELNLSRPQSFSYGSGGGPKDTPWGPLAVVEGYYYHVRNRV